MTSAAEMLTVADKGGGGLSLTSAKILKFWQFFFKSSVPITMRETAYPA